MKRLLPLLGFLGLAGLAAVGCGNATGFSRAPSNATPVAVIGTPAPPYLSFAGYVLDGGASYDPDGQVVEWDWSVVTKPAGSALVLNEIQTTPAGSKVAFTPDLLGSYSMQLVVKDNDGAPSLPAVFAFDVAGSPGIMVQLTWDTDYNDVDLHLVDEAVVGGGFFTSPGDCYFQNMNPDWGSGGLPDGIKSDDPTLPQDVTTGFGPELIGIPAPVPGSYHVYSHYYCDDGLGATDATIKVFVNGTSLYAGTATLNQTGALWDVATITVGSGGTATVTVSTAGISLSSHGCGGG